MRKNIQLAYLILAGFHKLVFETVHEKENKTYTLLINKGLKQLGSVTYRWWGSIREQWYRVVQGRKICMASVSPQKQHLCSLWPLPPRTDSGAHQPLHAHHPIRPLDHVCDKPKLCVTWLLMSKVYHPRYPTS